MEFYFIFFFFTFNSAPNFHLPTQIERPVVMVGPGTGVAPFRGFWEHKHMLQSQSKIKHKHNNHFMFVYKF